MWTKHTSALCSSDNYTTFIYLEDDILLSWEALQAWAEDTEHLVPLGFQRGFFRIEYSHFTGQMMVWDQVNKINLTDYDRILTLHTNVERQHFLQLSNPYMGMWLATSQQLFRFKNSKWWSHHSSKKWMVREMAACAMQLVDVPANFTSAAIVPYNYENRSLDIKAGVFHLTNNYCGSRKASVQHKFCRITLAGYLVT